MVVDGAIGATGVSGRLRMKDMDLGNITKNSGPETCLLNKQLWDSYAIFRE